MSASLGEDGVSASALELVEVEEVVRLLASQDLSAFAPAELAYARARSDPARRLAARLAAKRAARALLGEDLALEDFEIVRGEHGPPALRLSPRAQARLHERGAGRALVSLTHERGQAAALVVLVGER